MQTVCPITDKRINERVSRLNALFTVLLTASFIVFHWWLPFAVLAADFVIRGFIDSKYSPICHVSKWVVDQVQWKGKVINAGPKIFAAQVGMALSAFSLIAFATGCHSVCMAVASVLLLFSFLEGALGFCVACKIYPLFRKII